MSAYLFTGWTSQFKTGHLADSCVSLIVYGGTLEHANDCFSNWLLGPRQGDEPVPTKIEQIVSAPVLEHLFTETGPVPLDWAQVCQEAAGASEVPVEELFEQGYWADCDALVSPDDLAPDLESLRNGLPEEVRSGLNWSGDKQHIFLVSALSPPPAPPAEFSDEEEPDTESEPAEADTEDVASFGLSERGLAFPELAGKEVAVVVRARNSVVAAWLWRRHAASTPLARNSIRVDPWYGAAKAEDENTSHEG